MFAVNQLHVGPAAEAQVRRLRFSGFALCKPGCLTACAGLSCKLGAQGFGWARHHETGLASGAQDQPEPKLKGDGAPALR